MLMLGEKSEPFQLERVACFGRSFDEYTEMLGLNCAELIGTSILDCAGGPSSFTAEANRKGIKAVACDPVYALHVDDIITNAEHDIPACIRETQKHRERFMRENSEEDIVFLNEKMKALKTFSDDFRKIDACRRYIPSAFPHLPFFDSSFDMVVCANLLFLYSNIETGGILPASIFDYKFHQRSLCEMIRICRKEVRIYPIVGPNSQKHPYIEALFDDPTFFDFEMEIVPVSFKDVRGACQMLKISK